MNTVLLKLGICAAVALAAFVWHEIDRRAAYAEGQRDERIVWQERQRKAEAQIEAARQQAQAEINRIESDLLTRLAEEETAMADLRKALEHEKALGRACAAVSRELRDKLNAIGRGG